MLHCVWILIDCVAMFKLLYGCLLLLLCETLAPSEPQVPRAARQPADAVCQLARSFQIKTTFLFLLFFNSTHQCLSFVPPVCVCQQ